MTRRTKARSTYDRRQFLKALGISTAGVALAGCDLPSYVTLEEGEETVNSYLAPDEYMIPGVGVWYASTCLQCAAGCSVHGRVREGRVLKLEGNAQAGINSGRLCQMGQAALQTHFNPDRLNQPMIRKDGKLQTATWDEALALIAQKSGSGRGAWVSGSISGHQRVLIETHLDALGGGSHYAIEAVNSKIWESACRDMLGDPNPTINIADAKVVVSLGADFLGASVSPVHFQTQYGKFRSVPRGTLIQVEPAMSMTGANADHWVGVSPGGETAVALGIAHQLIYTKGRSTNGLSPELVALINSHDAALVTAASGVPALKITKIVELLAENSPSLILAGGSATASTDGYQAAASALVLNHILGNVGRTLKAGNGLAHAQLAPLGGGTGDLAQLANDAKAGRIDTAFTWGTNPLFTAPTSLGLQESWGNIGFKVAFANFADETTAQADVVLPMASSLEDWGTHIAAYDSDKPALLLQQPLMEPIFDNTRGFGDVVLGLAKAAGAAGLDDFDDYYGYLRAAISALMNSELETDWNAVLMKGQIDLPVYQRRLNANHLSLTAPKSQGAAGKLTLITPARQGMWDGRHANLTWLQEAPDQISKVVWDSWAEVHPKTAARLGVEDGDYLNITSAGGTITTRVFVYKGVHPDAICVPMGRGHTDYGRWATNNGVNPLSILDAAFDATTGELATSATLVDVKKAGKNRQFATLMEVDSQYGRKLVATIPAKQQSKTEGGA